MQYRILVQQWQWETAQLSAAVDAELAVLTTRQLDYIFHPKRWTIRQYLQHIGLYNAMSLEKAKTAINALQDTGPGINLMIRPISTWLMRRVQPENLAPYRTRPEFDPRRHPCTDDVFRQFPTQQQQLAALLERSLEVDFNRPLIPAGPFGIIRLSLAEQLWYILQHEQKHIRQAMHLANLVPEDV